MGMSKYVAFLRGINVGGRIVRVVDLKDCFEKAGYSNVITLLQSGNVVFESSKTSGDLKKEIEETLTRTFNYPAKTQVLNLEKLKQIIDDYPFGEATSDQHDYVIFLENGLEDDLVNESCELAPGEQVQAGNGVVYWRVEKGSTLVSNFAKLLTKAKYKDYNTNRNIRTLRKIFM
jgi:uncharacterized protein (DUF1697 family)